MRRLLGLACLFAGVACAAQTVEVGVFSLFRPQRLIVKPAAAQVLRVEIDGSATYLEGAQSATFRRAARVTARDGGPAEFTLAVPGRIERRFRGTLRIASRAGALEAVVSMDLETAVASVVAAESPPAAPLEARKAQAVAARSYFRAARGRHNGFDFCDTTHCQFLREPVADESAARETAGLVLVHESAVVGALYSAACGGRTKSLAEVGLPERGYPFFPVDCEACRRQAREWMARFTGPDAERLLGAPHSETARLAIVRRLGWSALAGNNYEIARDGDAVVLHGRGAGHGVGLCQQGAASMAAAGAGFRAILNHYFPATTLR
jgi:stage II sporulation protein D